MKTEYSRLEKAAALQREYNLRNKVYKREVKAGDMKQAEASLYLTIWEGIMKDYDIAPNMFVPEHPARLKIDELKREISIRQGFYPQQVRAGKMTEEEKNYQISIMQAILEDYQKTLTPSQEQ